MNKPKLPAPVGGDTQFNIVNNWPDGRLLTPVSLGFPGGASGKQPVC